MKARVEIAPHKDLPPFINERYPGDMALITTTGEVIHFEAKLKPLFLAALLKEAGVTFGHLMALTVAKFKVEPNTSAVLIDLADILRIALSTKEE